MAERTRAAPASFWLAAMLLAADADALSLRSTKAEAFLGDVRPGSRAVFGQAAGAPLGAENAGGEEVDVGFSAASPPPERLKDGYEPLPDLRWVALTGESRRLGPGERAETDAIVTVPKNAAGGQYQFDLLLSGRSPGGSGLTLRTAVLLAVGAGEPEDVPPEPEGSAFTLSPSKGRLERAPLGRAPKDLRGPKLANAGEEDLVVRLTAVRARPADMRLEEGYTPAPNPLWLTSGSPVRVPAGGVVEAPLRLLIPARERYRGRRWAFTVAVDASAKGRRGRTWWTLYVGTE